MHAMVSTRPRMDTALAALALSLLFAASAAMAQDAPVFEATGGLQEGAAAQDSMQADDAAENGQAPPGNMQPASLDTPLRGSLSAEPAAPSSAADDPVVPPVKRVIPVTPGAKAATPQKKNAAATKAPAAVAGSK